MVQPGDRVVVVMCIGGPEDSDVFHVFSSDEAAIAYCGKDAGRAHVISDRMLDVPERLEGTVN